MPECPHCEDPWITTSQKILWAGIGSLLTWLFVVLQYV